MPNVKSVADWLAERGMSLPELIEASRLDKRVVQAIVAGRYTPSPDQRQQIASALGVGTEMVAWGTSVRCSTCTVTARSSAAARDGGWPWEPRALTSCVSSAALTRGS